MPVRGEGTLDMEVTSMPKFRNIIRSLMDLPRGFSADGRPIGVGLDAALKAQRARGADGLPSTSPARRASSTEDRPLSPA
jgi:hypothetical protein